MSAVIEFVTEVANDLKPSHVLGGVSAETPFLDFLKEIFQQLLPLLIGCLPVAQRNAGGLTAAMQRPNLRQRLGLRFQIRRNIDDPRTGSLTIGEIEDAFFARGSKMTEERAAVLLAEMV